MPFVVNIFYEVDLYAETEKHARLKVDASINAKSHCLLKSFIIIQVTRGVEMQNYHDLCINLDIDIGRVQIIEN